MSDTSFISEVKKFQPTYKMVLLTVHPILVSGFTLLFYPFTKLIGLMDQTYLFESHNKK